MGRLADGSVFDSSRSRNAPFKFVLGTGAVIRAWDAGFGTMAAGEAALLVASAAAAYGAAGSPPTIPPDATLYFEVELLSFGPKKKQTWEMTNAEKRAAAEAAKADGNAAFAKGDLAGAADAYARGVECVDAVYDDDGEGGDGAALGGEGGPPAGGDAPAGAPAPLRALRAALHLNAAAVALKRGDFAGALKSANAALKAEPGAPKALFRRGAARAGLGDLDAAKADLAAAAAAAPGDAAIKAEAARVAGLIKAAREKEKVGGATGAAPAARHAVGVLRAREGEWGPPPPSPRTRPAHSRELLRSLARSNAHSLTLSPFPPPPASPPPSHAQAAFGGIFASKPVKAAVNKPAVAADVAAAADAAPVAVAPDAAPEAPVAP